MRIGPVTVVLGALPVGVRTVSSTTVRVRYVGRHPGPHGDLQRGCSPRVHLVRGLVDVEAPEAQRVVDRDLLAQDLALALQDGQLRAVLLHLAVFVLLDLEVVHAERIGAAFEGEDVAGAAEEDGAAARQARNQAPDDEHQDPHVQQHGARARQAAGVERPHFLRRAVGDAAHEEPPAQATYCVLEEVRCRVVERRVVGQEQQGARLVDAVHLEGLPEERADVLGGAEAQAQRQEPQKRAEP